MGIHGDFMSDPRNVAHAKKVTQEKKHQGAGVGLDEMSAAQSGKKSAANKKRGGAGAAAALDETMAIESVEPAAPTAKPSASLEGSLSVLAKLTEMEFYSRANLERLAELSLTVEDDLKQKEMVGPLGEVLSAQNVMQTKLSALIEVYKAECDRMQGESV
jgi:hypothetical protein